ncbi:MAG: alcohol dehydrogenase catalytic domain-containing protein [Fimbriimonadaceae bacterium]|nr:alcohol dehydrogenase catalytic domain-containing protein [Chthonomonadaceae bacterium]MCO5296915.1 alcohol dehydrogenase catalytic domain-containing protein [Fimbriimonadaceae bacterium]
MKIRAALLEAPGEPFRIEHLDLAEPGNDEVRVRVRAAGICHSDWHLVTGDTRHPFPLVAGHEGCGVVDAVGPGVQAVRPGDFVALNWAPSCGRCFHCGAGRPALCSTYVEPIWAGTMLDGTTRLTRNGAPVYHYSALACFAEACVVPEGCCVVLPPDTPAETAALIGCAVTTGVGSVMNTAKVPRGASVVVLGAGGVGLSTVMGANLAGASPVIAVDVHPGKESAARNCGATEFFLNDEHLVKRVIEATDGLGADFVFEAVGLPSLQEQTLDLVRAGGTVVLSGLSPMGSATNLPGARLVRREIAVLGSYYGTCVAARDFPLYASMSRDGRLPLERLVSRTVALDQINEAYAEMLAGEGARRVIVF